ncbi:LacI family DNA-binding transcriptional regulator [Kribbella sp. NPDC059898]|uniref:LacI family DNA-binding transcriptional regulator n=1 Tax=Kribbella sp. NPDC059898 TaxID=3346995 RepID=UPI00365CCE6E
MNDDRMSVREIAKLAGVSIATVSRVYRGVGSVSPTTRAKVQAAIEQYGYRPSHLGEALANRRHGALAVVFPGLSGPYFAELINGVETVAVPRQVSVHVIGTHLRREAPDELLDVARRVDGMAIHGGTVPETVIAELAARHPVVMIGPDPHPAPVVVRTDQQAFRLMVDHLLADHGLRKLIFVGNPEGSPDLTERWNAFVAGHAALGLRPGKQFRTGLEQTHGVQAADEVLAGGYDGAVCGNDETALGLMMAVLGRGLRVPGDLVITGVDDVPMSSLVSPGLTTVARPLAELGATATRLLLDLINGADVPPETVLPSRLVRRASCGCEA